MFILLFFIVIFSLVILSINKKQWIKNQAPAIIAKDSSEPVFEKLIQSEIKRSSSGEDMSEDKNTAPKPPGKLPKTELQELNLEDDMNKARLEALSQPSSPRSRKSATMKISCLCAPTNHPGSFRCRYHRNSMSVGSNLSELAFRKTASVGANLSDLGNTDTTASTMKRSRRPREC